MHERHNAILQRLSKAIPESEGDRYLEQKVKDVPGDLRPDLVLWHGDGKVSIIDVTIPYEGDENAFKRVRNEKKAKYQPIGDWLMRKGKTDVVIDAFVIGSLGSWDTANEQVLKRLRIGPKYANLFRKLHVCTVNAIKGSLTIWKSSFRCVTLYITSSLFQIDLSQQAEKRCCLKNHGGLYTQTQPTPLVDTHR